MGDVQEFDIMDFDPDDYKYRSDDESPQQNASHQQYSELPIFDLSAVTFDTNDTIDPADLGMQPTYESPTTPPKTYFQQMLERDNIARDEAKQEWLDLDEKTREVANHVASLFRQMRDVSINKKLFRLQPQGKRCRWFYKNQSMGADITRDLARFQYARMLDLVRQTGIAYDKYQAASVEADISGTLAKYEFDIDKLLERAPDNS